MKRFIPFCLFTYLLLPSLNAQTGADSTSFIRMITTMENGYYEIRELTRDSVLLYKGRLSLTDPEIRDGRFYFFHPDGTIEAMGRYNTDVPVGKWVYFGRDFDTLAVIDYDQVLVRPDLPDFNIEVVRALSESPRWEPAEQEGIAVNFMMSLLIHFNDDEIDGIENILGEKAVMEEINRNLLSGANDTVITVDVMPLFNGGDPALEFRKFIAMNLKYPESAAEQGIGGRVIVQFTVRPDGSLDEISVINKVHPALATEAMRVVASSPKWTPGRSDGEPVPVVFTFPFTFTVK